MLQTRCALKASEAQLPCFFNAAFSIWFCKEYEHLYKGDNQRRRI